MDIIKNEFYHTSSKIDNPISNEIKDVLFKRTKSKETRSAFDIHTYSRDELIEVCQGIGKIPGVKNEELANILQILKKDKTNNRGTRIMFKYTLPFIKKAYKIDKTQTKKYLSESLLREINFEDKTKEKLDTEY